MSALISRIQQKKFKNIEKCGFYKGKTKNGARPFKYLESWCSGAYEKSKKLESFYKHHGAYKNECISSKWIYML